MTMQHPSALVRRIVMSAVGDSGVPDERGAKPARQSAKEPSGSTSREIEVYGNDFRNVRLPMFWRNRPSLWFAQLENEFVAYRIRSDDVQYRAVVRHLDEETMLVVADFLERPPDTDKYNKFKNTLITRFMNSLEKQLRTLLSGVELGDKTPSALLQEMRTLAGTNVTDDLLRTLWLQRLPQRIQELLTILVDVDLNKLADYADKALEQAASPSIAAVVQPCQDEALKNLTEQVERLATQVAAMQAQLNTRRSRRSRSRSTSRESGVCYFHNKFGNKAWKCVLPCNAPYPLVQQKNSPDRRQ